MPPQMDPYTGEMQDSSILGTIGAMANPVEIAKFKYTMDPRVWGGSLFGTNKGAWMPIKFQNMNLGKFTRDTGKLMKQRGLVKGTMATIGKARSLWDSQNYIGGGYLRSAAEIKQFRGAIETNLYKYFRDATTEMKFGHKAGKLKGATFLRKRTYTPGKADRLARMFRQDIFDWMDEAGSTNRLSAKALRERLSATVSNREFIGTFGDVRNKLDDIMAKVGVAKKAAGRGARRTAGIAATARATGAVSSIGKLGSASFKFAGAARLGLFAAKGLSLIGAASMLWDITQFIAQPIGNTLVHEANRVMENYSQRFMPELGGRLSMSYMSTGAATERQRAVQAISKAYINGRSAFGQEAAYMHG